MQPVGWMLVVVGAVVPGSAGLGPLAAQQDSVFQRAEVAMQAGEWARAEEAYRAVLAADSTRGMAWFRLGMALHAQERYADALAPYRRAVALGAQVLSAEVRLARAFARLGRADSTFAHLETAVAMGLNAPSALEQQADFAAIRADPRYAESLRRVQAAAEPCMSNPVNRAFDFWIGEWDVYAGGTQAGTNRIERILGGCVLFENWTSAGGQTGKSFNYYDPNTGQWRQLWVDQSGTVIDFDRGDAGEGMMQFFAETVSAAGATVRHRLTFTRLAADSVRQHWESSNDGGVSWSTVFDGLYVRRVADAQRR